MTKALSCWKGNWGIHVSKARNGWRNASGNGASSAASTVTVRVRRSSRRSSETVCHGAARAYRLAGRDEQDSKRVQFVHKLKEIWSGGITSEPTIL